MGVLDQHPALFYPKNPVTGVAELENVARDALESEVLVQRANAQALRLHNHVVIELVGNGAAVLQRHQPRRGACSQPPIDGVVVQVCGTSPAATGIAL